MDPTSNPGSATPETLYRIYKDRAAATANPFVLRDMQTTAGLSFASTIGQSGHERAEERESLLQQRAILAPMPPMRSAHASNGTIGERRRADSPPRGHFRVITHCGASAPLAAQGAAVLRAPYNQQPHACAPPTHVGRGASLRTSASGPPGARTGLQLTLNSLDMSRR